MRTETTSSPDAMQPLPPIVAEAGLLELFAPTSSLRSTARPLPKDEHAPLWRADALHRAKNMAQMTNSLANVADHSSRLSLPPEVTSEARCLSRAYEELGADDDPRARVPCAVLLTEIVTRLANIFGRSRQVAMVVSADAVLLPADVRRALVLMASELVINALKYGYPTAAGGTISVSLAERPGEVELVVEDDGSGLVETYRPGQGGGLLEKLRLVLGATMTRTTGGQGHGFRVSASVPIDRPRDVNA